MFIELTFTFNNQEKDRQKKDPSAKIRDIKRKEAVDKKVKFEQNL